MPLYELKCAEGHRTEVTQSFYDEIPLCPQCDAPMTKVLSYFAIQGKATLPAASGAMPQTWRGTYDGNREYITKLRHEADARQKIEERYPELAGDRRPILAHEGRFASEPLRAGDSVIPARIQGSHTHGNGSGSTHGHSHGDTTPPLSTANSKNRDQKLPD